VSTAAGLLALAAGVVLVAGAAELLVDGLLGAGRRLRVAPFVLSVVLSGFEVENLAAGIAANAHGLPGAAAGTFLGGIVFLALAVAGLGGLIAPMRVELPRRFALWTAVAPLPLLVAGFDGRISRAEGGALVVWFAIALVGAARSGRELLGGPEGGSKRRPFARLIAGLAGLTGGGWLLGEGLNAVVRSAGIGAAGCAAGRTPPDRPDRGRGPRPALPRLPGRGDRAGDVSRQPNAPRARLASASGSTSVVRPRDSVSAPRSCSSRRTLLTVAREVPASEASSSCVSGTTAPASALP
jgi:cation:H+ antiporter